MNKPIYKIHLYLGIVAFRASKTMIPIETDNILAKEFNKITTRKSEDDIWWADFADMELVI